MKKSGKMTALLLAFTMLAGMCMSCGARTESTAVGGTGSGGNSKVTQAYHWKLAHEEYRGELEDNFAYLLKDELKKNSDGAIDLEIYRVGEIGDSTNLFELTQTGAIEFGISNPGAVVPVIPEAGIFSVHFLFPRDIHDFDRFVEGNSKGIKRLNELYENQGVTVLQWAVELGNCWTANKPLVEPKDFKGVKFRTMASTVIADSYKAYGASAVPIAYSELYSALQLHMVDGQVNPFSAIIASSFYEVQDYLILAYPDSFMMTLGANNDFLNSLPEKDRKVVEKSVQGAYERYKKRRDVLNKKWLKFLTTKADIKVIELNDAQVDEFRKIAEQHRDIYTNTAKENGKEVLKLFTEDLKEYNK